MIRILHTADLHLDSPFAGLSLDAAEEAREEQREVFLRMMQYAKDNSIDIVLIAGDLFDSKYITVRTKELVKEAFGSLPCPVVISPGNHDPYMATAFYRSGELPENVFVFSSEQMQVFDFDTLGVSVCGYAFLSDKLDRSPVCDFSAAAEGIRQKSENKLLLCAHADTQSPTSHYAPLSIFDIERCGFDYAALGHIHCPPSIESEHGLIRYSGFPSGRAFDEIGDGGAYVITLEDGERPSEERVIFSKHRFLKETLDVSGAEDESEIERMIYEHVGSKGYGNETSLRIELVGTLPLNCILNESALSQIQIPLRQLSVKNLTVPMPDSFSLKNDPSLRGELYRTLLPMLQGDDEEDRRLAVQALNLGLFAIEGKRLAELFTDRFLGGKG